MRSVPVWLILLLSSLGLIPEAFAQSRVPFEPGAWKSALSQEYHIDFLQVQVGKAPEGPVVKAVFEDSSTAALPLERQEASARAVAQFILARAATEPDVALVIVGWKARVNGIPTAQTFRFSAKELREGSPEAVPQ